MSLAIKLIVAAIFGVYALFWISFMPLFAFGIAYDPAAAARLLIDPSGPDGIAGPLFLWFLIICNPIVLTIVWRRSIMWRARRSKENF